jgi:putative photosynthetic complex assembly protein 2
VEHASGWARFRDATLVVIHHELALAGTVLLLVAITWHAPNQVGTWTFFALWVMRLSAKLNLFLGVRNVNLDLVPSHLRYMTSYFRQARFNGLMPLSLATLACAAWLLLRIAAQAPSDGFLRTSSTLLATLVGLAALEHVFLAVPLRDAVLWRWATRRAEPATPRALGAP